MNRIRWPEKEPLILWPSLKRGNGTGHLKRCFELAEELGPSVRLYLPAADQSGFFSSSEIEACIGRSVKSRLIDYLPDRAAVLLDQRATLPATIDKLKDRHPLIALDEGGAGRQNMDYLVDTLPGLAKKTANLSDTGLLRQPRHRRSDFPSAVNSVLLSFGGEDRTDLTGACLRQILEARLFQPGQITVVSGPLARSVRLPEGVIAKPAHPNLREDFAAHDLVITSFGLTAYEALAAGCLVLLANPGVYHQKLAVAAGWPTIPAKNIAARLAGWLDRLPRLARRLMALQRPPLSLAAHLAALRPRKPCCPVCRPATDDLPVSRRLLYRCVDRNFYRCDRCGIIFQNLLTEQKIRYDQNYFFDEYQKQYGKTYLQDFAHLQTLARSRVARLKGLLPRQSAGPIVDVGCAYGAFLKTAADAGFTVMGIDPSKEAVAYVAEQLGLPAARQRFDQFRPGQPIAGLTLWYVVEHFEKTGEFLQKAAEFLPAGAVLALSTPNSRGVSGRRDLKRFLRLSPLDHYTIWDPKTARSLLRKTGFRVKKIVSAGHHPGRWPALLRPAAAFLSRLLGLGDTFEIYAVKNGDFSPTKKRASQ